MKTNLHKFSTSIKKITHYLHSPLQTYEHFNRFINIFKHCRPCSLAAVSLHKRPPYCTQIRMPPNTWSVVIFAKIEIPEGLTAILHNNFNMGFPSIRITANNDISLQPDIFRCTTL